MQWEVGARCSWLVAFYVCSHLQNINPAMPMGHRSFLEFAKVPKPQIPRNMSICRYIAEEYDMFKKYHTEINGTKLYVPMYAKQDKAIGLKIPDNRPEPFLVVHDESGATPLMVARSLAQTGRFRQW
jgi:hypothetical protein